MVSCINMCAIRYNMFVLRFLIPSKPNNFRKSGQTPIFNVSPFFKIFPNGKFAFLTRKPQKIKIFENNIKYKANSINLFIHTSSLVSKYQTKTENLFGSQTNTSSRN